MKLPVAILMVIVSANLAGCLSSNPSESDGKEAVLKYYKKYIDSGDLVVESVKKTDGQEMDFMGVKFYEMKVDVTLKYPKGHNCKTQDMETQDMVQDIVIFCSGRSDAVIATGFSETVPKKVRFEKSEKGWQYSPSPFGL